MPRISCHCTVSQKEKTTLCLAKGLPPYWCPTCTWVQNIQQIRLSLSKILSKSADCNNHNITWFHDKSSVIVANHFSPLWDQMQRYKQIFLPHVIWLFEMHGKYTKGWNGLLCSPPPFGLILIGLPFFSGHQFIFVHRWWKEQKQIKMMS